MKRDQIEESLAFANAIAKVWYNKSHKAISLPTESEAYLRLYYEYEISGIGNKKLHPQRIEPFKIIDKIDSLAYQLQLPPLMKIHSMISIAQLEPSQDSDPYKRQVNAEPPPVVETETDDTYIIEKLLDKRITRGKVRYLVKWLGWGNEHNV